MEHSTNIDTAPMRTGVKHFKFFEGLDKILLEQDAQNAAQKKWAEIDALLDIVVIPVAEIDIPANPYL